VTGLPKAQPVAPTPQAADLTPSVSPSARRRVAASAAQVIAPILSVLFTIALWEIAPRAGWVNPTLLPSFSEVVGELPVLFEDDDFMTNVWASGSRWATGLVLAVLIGIPVGLAMGRSRAVAELMNPIMVLSYSFPKAALILLLVLWFGVGNFALVTVIVFGCFAPIVISSYHGSAGVNPHLLWSARALGVSRPATLFRVVLPAATPQILSGLRIALIVSLFTILSSELLMRRDGIGAYMFTNLDTGQYLVVYAVSLLIAIFGFVLDFAYVRAVRLGVPWSEGEV
jgi:NitT/TauT family transport system permease protein